MHSLPGRLHSLVYLREFRAPTKRKSYSTCGKAKRINGFQRGRRRGQVKICVVQRLSGGSPSATFQVPRYRALHTLLARFTRHVLSPLRSRLRSLRLYVYDRYGCPSRPSSRQLLDVLLRGDTEINGLHPRVKGRILLLSSLLSFHANLSPLSLNPRYPRADHLGNLSSCVDDIADSDRAWEPNDLSRDVEYVDISRRGDRSLPRVFGSVVLFPAVSRNPRDPSITNV